MSLPGNPPATTTPAAFKTWAQDVADTAADHDGRIGDLETDTTPDDTAYDATSWNGATTRAPSKNAVRDKIETLAPLASPALTGNPTAPTASVGDNDTSIATTAFVNAEIANDAVLLTGAQAVAGVKTFSSDPIIPDEAYDATAWNGVLEPPTKNAVRDKIEDILDGVTFTGDVVVPDEAYDATAWNGSLEVPTKNAVRDKIETLVGGTVDDTAYDATSWNGVTTIAPSKNAVRDVIETISSAGVSDGDKGHITVSSSGSVWTIDSSGMAAIAADSALTGAFEPLTGAVCAKARRSTTQSISNSTLTAVDLTATDDWDSDGFHDPGSNPSRMTVPSGKAGKYRVTGWFTMASGSTGYRVIGFSVNGVGISEQMKTPAPSSGSTYISLSVDLALAVGDYVEMNCTHTQGASLNLNEATLSLQRFAS